MKIARTICAALIVFILGLACTSYIPTQYYQIDSEPPVEKAGKQYALTMAVRALRAPSRYKDQIVYRSSEYNVGFYEYSQWVEPPAEMVGRTLVNALKKADLFEGVDPLGLIAAPDLVLQGSIVRFDQVISKEGNLADCELSIEILPGDGGKPVLSFTAKEMVEQEKKGEFVPAMSAAVDEAISKIIASLENSPEIQELAENKEKPAPTPTPEAP